MANWTIRRVPGLAVLIVLLLASLLPARAASGGGPSTYVVSPVSTREQRSAIASTGAGIDDVRADSVVVRATAAERDAIAAQGFTVEGTIGATDFPPADAAYHNYAETLAELDALVAAHPTRARRFTLGRSYENRLIDGLRISDDTTDNLSEPGALYIGMHHAREHLTVEVVLAIARHFLESADPAVQALVTGRQLYIVPMLNPDGGEWDVATGSYQLWRKNRQPNGTAAVGTDLNRNYAYRWACCGGSSGTFSSETYRGAAPFSAPETQVMRDFVVAHTNITTALSYHSHGELVMYPYGYTYTDVPADMTLADHQTLVAMAGEMARTTGYTAQQSSDLYITDGDWIDWMYGDQGRYPFTIELGPDTFYPPPSYIPTAVAENLAAAVYVAGLADCPPRAAALPCDGGPPPSGDAVNNGNFDQGLAGWTWRGVQVVDGTAQLGGANGVKDWLRQSITVPSGSPVLRLLIKIDGNDTSTRDKFKVQVIRSGTTRTLATVTAATPHGVFQEIVVPLGNYAGQGVALKLLGVTNASAPTTFTVDDVSVG